MKLLLKNLPSIQKASQPAAIICIALVTFFIFSPCLKGNLLNWDDDVHLTENRFVRGLSLEHLQGIFTQRVNNTYHPLTTLSFALEYYFVGYRPFLYHLNNVLLHIGVAVLAFLFLRQLNFSVFIACLSTLFFAVHPARVESVAWVTERKDVLYAFFYMAALLAYLRYRKTEDQRFYGLAILLFFLSMLSKAMALSFPLILLLCDWYQGRKFDKKVLLEKIPFFLVAAGIAAITYVKFVRVPVYAYYEALMIWPWTLVFYIKKFFYPGVLIPIYDVALPVSITNPEYLFAFVVLFALIVLLIFGRKHRWFLFSFGFFFLSIFFLLRLDYGFDSQIVADRFMYLPSLGFSLLIAFFLERISRSDLLSRKLVQCAAGVLLVGILCSFAVIARYQCRAWRNDDTIWSHQAAYNINTPIATNNLSLLFEIGLRKDIFERDINILKERIRRDPDHIELLKRRASFRSLKEIVDVTNLAEKRFVLLHRALSGPAIICEPIVNLADLYARLGFPDIAAEHYYWALREDFNYMKAHYDLAFLYADLGRDQESIDKYWEALRLKKMDSVECGRVVKDLNEIIEKRRKNGEDASAFLHEREILYVYLRDLTLANTSSTTDAYAMAIAFENMQNWHAAAEAYKRSVKESPQDVNRILALGNAYLQERNYRSAIIAYQDVLRVDPRNEKAYLNLGVAFDRLNQYDQAIESYEKVLALNTDHALAYCNLGRTYQSLGKNEKAIELYKQAIAVKPDYDKAFYDMGSAWLKLKDVQQAESAYRKAIEINPRHIDALMNLSIVLFYQKKFQEAKDFCQKAQNLGLRPPRRYLQALDYYLADPATP